MLKPLSPKQHAFLISLLLAVALIASLFWLALTNRQMPERSAQPESNTAQYVPAATTPAPALKDESLAKALMAARYGLESRESAPFSKRPGAGYLAMSHEQNLNAWFDKEGVTIRPTVTESEQPSAWHLGIRLKAYGYGERMEEAPPVLSQKVLENRIEYERAFPQVAKPEPGFALPDLNSQIRDSILRAARPRVIEWYENNSSGIEQGFTLSGRPAGLNETTTSDRLRFVLSLSGDLRARLKDDGQAIELLNAGGEPVMTYGQLAAMDADGKQLMACMATNETGDEIALEVDDRNATYPIAIDPLWQERARLVANDGEQVDKFGSAVDISGDMMVIGARLDDVNGNRDRGSAYIFLRKGDKWIQQQKLVASNGRAEDEFGSAVAISGSTIVVGAPYHDTDPRFPDPKSFGLPLGTNEGSVYVFERKGSKWTQTKRLEASDTEGEFGRRWGGTFGSVVDISGNTIVVGAPSSKCGEAYVFTRSGNQFSNWEERQIFNLVKGRCLSYGSGFGTSIAISGQTIMIGAPLDVRAPVTSLWEAPPQQGVVYVYRGGGASWTETDKLIASDGRQYDRFGFSIAISGDTAIIGAVSADKIQQIDPRDGWSNDDEGAVYFFTSLDGGQKWTERQKEMGRQKYADFGWDVAISGDTAVVGSPSSNASGQEKGGAAYVYTRESNAEGFLLTQALLPSKSVYKGAYGASLAISGETMVIGAVNEDGKNAISGTAYTYQSPDTDGDGIPDEWEKNGIGFTVDNPDGTTIIKYIDLPKMGANYLHKDIFVHADSMPGRAPDPAALKKVVDAFNNAPLENPDGKKGIHLHIDAGPDYLDYFANRADKKWKDLSRATLVPFQEITGTIDQQNKQYIWSDVDAAKAISFDASQRRPVFHYVLFANKLPDSVFGKHRGIPSADTVIALGEPELASSFQQALTFMHELGHGLGLDHGGFEEVNYKPNYLSIMNNSFGVTGLLTTNRRQPRLDFSRAELPLLNERNLDELAGIRDPEKHLTRWETRTAPETPAGLNKCFFNGNYYRIFLPGDALDWNCDGVKTTATITTGLDINGDGICVAAGDSTLETPACNGSNNPKCDDERRFGAIVAGVDRKCETTAVSSDEQRAEPGFVQQDELGGYNDWSNLSFTGGGKIGNLAILRDPDDESRTPNDELPIKEILKEIPPELLDEIRNAPVDEVTLSPEEGMAPLVVNFDGSASKAIKGTIVKWEWDFGDGMTGTGATTSHTYTRAGEYDAQLTVTDSAGRVNLIPLLHHITVTKGVTPTPSPTPVSTPNPQATPTPVFKVGDTDTTFEATVSGNQSTQVSVLLSQPDGKILVGGDFESFGGCARQSLARLNPDGSCDRTFNPGLAFSFLHPDSTGVTGRAKPRVRALALQPNGKILVGLAYEACCQFTTDDRDRVVVRLNPDGTLDSTFKLSGLGNQTSSSVSVYAIAVQPDGRILIAGNFKFDAAGGRMTVLRLQPDGSLDTSFNASVGSNPAAGSSTFFPNGVVNALALQPDGKIIIGGSFAKVGGDISRAAIARLNADGTTDESFNTLNTGTGAFASGLATPTNIFALGLQPDGKIIVGGDLWKNGSQGEAKAFVRLNADGSRDTGFSSGYDFGLQYAAGRALALQADGKIVIAGDFRITTTPARNFIARLNADGTLDTSYDTGKGTLVPQPDPSGHAQRSVDAVALQPDGKAIIGGQFDYYDDDPAQQIVRLNADGRRDFSFESNGPGYNMNAYALARQVDGKLLVGFETSGNIVTKVSGHRTNGIGRINPDGTADIFFTPPFDNEHSRVVAIALQSDGKILVGGSFRLTGTTDQIYLARLNGDGTLDTGFKGGVNDQVQAFALQPDGKIIIGGSFTTVNGSNRFRLARLNGDGTLDSSFLSTGAGGVVRSLLIQPDGRIIVAGNFQGLNGTPRKNIARLQSNGSLDESFDPGSGPDDAVVTLALQGDGRILIGGYFFNYNGTARPGLARLDTKGALDTSFNPVNPGQRVIGALALQSDGKIFIGGIDYLSIPSTAPTNYIFRLNGDGTLDSTFPLATEVELDVSSRFSYVNAMLLESDDRLIIGGNFDVVNDVGSIALARIVTALPQPIPTPTPSPSPTPSPTLTPTPTPSPAPTPTPAAIIGLSAASYSINEGEALGVVSITVNRTVDTSTPASVDYFTSDTSALIPCQTNGNGIASDRCDYATSVGTLNFAAGETAKTVLIPIINDLYIEPPEVFNLSLRNLQAASPGAIMTATITIIDDDVQAPVNNPIDDQAYFIRQQYIDFLGRVPEEAGFNFWMNRMNHCPEGQICDRIDTSKRFFESDEFQERGFYVYRLYDAVLGRLPRYSRDFLPDVSRLNGPQTVSEQRQGKDRYLKDFMQKPEFRYLYGQFLTEDFSAATNAAGFVDALCARAGITPASVETLIEHLQNGTRDPAHTLEDFILTPEIGGAGTKFYDRARLVMQYFGYLRRDPEIAGLDFWWEQLTDAKSQHYQDYRFMVGGFLQSDEYRFRFALISSKP